MDKKQAIIVLDQVLDARSDGYEQSAWGFIKGLLETAHNSDYASALIKTLEKIPTLSSGEICYYVGKFEEERLNQSKD